MLIQCFFEVRLCREWICLLSHVNVSDAWIFKLLTYICLSRTECFLIMLVITYYHPMSYAPVDLDHYLLNNIEVETNRVFLGSGSTQFMDLQRNSMIRYKSKIEPIMKWPNTSCTYIANLIKFITNFILTSKS